MEDQCKGPGYQLGYSIGYAMARNTERGRNTVQEGAEVYDTSKPIIKGMIDGAKQALIDEFAENVN